MKKLVLIQLLILVSILYSQAQINQMEYFIDNDPGVGKGIAVSRNINESNQIEVSTNGLSEGFHYIVCRAKDSNGKWSLSESRSFYVTPQAYFIQKKDSIIGYEYFIDEDPGIGKGHYVNVSKSIDLVIKDSINIKDLELGFHTLSLRFFDETGKISLTESRSFYVTFAPLVSNPVSITEIEYCFDTLCPFNQGIPIVFSPNSMINQEFGIPTTNLNVGNHILYMRAKDSNGTWSFTVSNSFKIVNNSAPVTSDQTFTINENSPKDTKIGKIIATDPDGNALTYNVTLGNEKAVFSINSTGELIINDPAYLDFETNPSFIITVCVSDGISSVNSTVTVNLINVTEVGVNDQLVSSIVCYPNPSKGVFTVNGFNQFDNCNLEVFTLNGKLIYRKLNVNSQTEVDISEETNGVYMLRVTTDEKVITKKIVLNK